MPMLRNSAQAAEASQTLRINTSSEFPLGASLHKFQHSKKTVGILCPNQFYFLFLSPSLNFLFSCNRIIDVWEFFKVNQVITIVFAGKGFLIASIHPMLYQPLRKIIGDASV
jgi:hypothetical protein